MPLIGATATTSSNQTPAETVIMLLHLSGAGLVTVALYKSARRLADSGDQIVRLVTVGLLLNLVAFAFSTEISGGAREIAVVLPLGAALAAPGVRAADRGRAQAYRDARGGSPCRSPACWCPTPSRPSAPPDASGAEIWLQGSTATTMGLAATGTRTTSQSRPEARCRYDHVNTGPQGIVQYVWDSDSTWYDPAKHYADFIVFDAAIRGRSSVYARPQQAVTQFGPPVRTVQLPGGRS